MKFERINSQEESRYHNFLLIISMFHDYKHLIYRCICPLNNYARPLDKC